MNKDTRESNSIRNFSAGLFNQVILLVANLISKSVFIKTLGITFMGINGLFTNIFLLLSFAEFGIGSVMVYSLYNPISQEDQGGIARVYYLFQKIYRILNGLIMIAGICLVPALPWIVKVETPVPYLTGYYLLYLIGIVISNIVMYNSHLILADQKAYILSLYGLVFEGLTMALQILLLLKTQNYAIYLGLFIMKNAGYALATSFKVRKSYPFLRRFRQDKGFNQKEKGAIYRKILDVFSYKFARIFITGTDNILISVLVGTIWVGYYSNYDLIIVGVLSLVSVFYKGISASLGNFIAKEDLDHQYQMFELMAVINMWITGFTTTCLFVLFQDFIRLWLGKEYLLDFPVVILIIINFYLVCNRKSVSIFREASGLFNKIKYAMFIGAVLNVGLSFFLGRLIGLYGVLLGTILSTLATYYWYEARLLIKDQFKRSLGVFFKQQLETLLYGVVSIVITSLGVSIISGVSLGSFIIKVLICLTLPNLFYLLVLRQKDQFQVLSEIGLRTYQKIIRR